MAVSLLDAAEAVRLSASAPIAVSKKQTGSLLYHQEFTTALYPGHGVREVQAPNIVDQDLLWPRSVRVFEAMRRDPQIQGLLLSVFLPIRHLDWYVDPGKATPATADYIAEDLGLPLLGAGEVSDITPGINFDDHLRSALLALAHGHRYFEESGEIDQMGRYRVRWLKDYPPTAIQEIFVDSQGGLVGIRVPSANPTVDGPFKDVLADHLVAHVWDREAADWAGRSLLVGIKDVWEDKYRLLRANVQMSTRFAGVPIGTTTDQNAKEPDQRAVAEMAQAIHAGYGAGGVLPFGYDLKIHGIDGAVPDIVKSCEYIDAQMARAFMQMFAELGKVGSRALGTTLLDHYTLGVMAVAKWARRTLNELVDRVVERNEGPLAVRPTVAFRQSDHEDLTTGDLVALIESGAIVVDDDLEATIRDRANLPARNPGEPGRTPPKAAPATIAAASADERPAVVAEPGTPAAAARTDFGALQAAHAGALEHLTSVWTGVQAGQIDALAAQIAKAATIAGIAAVAAPVLGVDLLTSALDPLVQHGAESVLNEADAQGHTFAHVDLTAADLRIEQAAEATAGLLADSLTVAAKSKAAQVAGPGVSMQDVADMVSEHLRSMSGSTVGYELSGLVSHAQNEGRFTVLDQSPSGTRFYGSELNDVNTCAPCEHEDDTEFASMSDARRDYPAGGYVACLGGRRCRGTVVAVFPETGGQAA